MKILLGILTAFLSMSAIAGGFLLVMEPGGSDQFLVQLFLRDAPVRDFLVPGILLLLAIGSINGLALIFQISGNKNWYNWTLAGASMLLVYIVLQILIRGEWSWLQLFYIFTGGFMVLLTWQLRGKWAA